VRSARSTLLGAAAGIAVVTVVARAVGFGRTVVFSQTVGTQCVGDTYQAANTIPNVVFEVVAGGALASLVVPVLAGAVAAGDRERASRTTSALLTWSALVLVPVSVLGWFLAPTVVRLLLGSDPTCGPEVLEVGTSMLRVFLPQVVLYGVAVVATGVLQAHHRFLWPALAPLVSSVVVAGAYLVYAGRGEQELAALSRSQELVLSVGTTLGVAALALAVLVPLKGTGLRVRPTLAFPDGVAAQARALAAAGLAVLAAQQAALVVALRLAAGGSRGDVAVFSVALTLFLVPWAVLAVPVATSAFPRLSALADQPEEFAAVARRTTQVVLVLTLAGSAALFAVADPLAALLGAGEPMAGAIRGFAPGLVGYGLLALVTRTLYARGDGRAAATATVVGWAVVVLADVLLVRVDDLDRPAALALGNAVGMTFAAVLLLRALHAAVPSALAGTARTAGVGVLAAVAVGVVSGALPTSPDDSVVLSLALAAGLGAGALVVVAGTLRVADPASLRAVRGG
jgi:putative peptidoglycan lipid II flippase